MAHLIDKDAIVAEIKKRIDSNNERAAFYSSNSEHDYLCRVKERVYESLLSFLNTLETKEVDLEKEIGLFTTKQLLKKRNHSTGVFHLTQIDVNNIAKHFFELGLKAKDWREERMKECPYKQVGCTMYSGTILECRGACSWVVDYPKLKELEEKKGE